VTAALGLFLTATVSSPFMQAYLNPPMSNP
jgi:hypothetical protein